MNLLGSVANVLHEFLSPEGPPEPDAWLQAINTTRGTQLASRLEVANSGSKRNKGLLGRSGLLAGEGMWIVPCESVHTFFMRFPIDLIYIDRQNRIRKIRSSVGAWRLSACLRAHSVLELPAGTIRDTGTECGDKVDFNPQAPDVAP